MKLRNNKGTIETILGRLSSNTNGITKIAYVAFLDLEKSFNYVDWKKMSYLLNKRVRKVRDRRVTFNL